MIKPTVGRVVWFHPEGGFSGVTNDKTQPLAAIVTYVWHDRMVNLVVFDHNGTPFGKTSVQLVQEEDSVEGSYVPQGYYCEWMPYQIGQAAKYYAEKKND